ncbi:hypothetical protein U879_03540 [Defluviimonas sp. 20V17]|nr:hypothetical protein U879_03540 [Defluviimonas sp. 20V17]
MDLAGALVCHPMLEEAPQLALTRDAIMPVLRKRKMILERLGIEQSQLCELFRERAWL